MRILVVEDNETDSFLIQRYLRKRWPQCELGLAGRRSELSEALKQSWDLIVSDYHLLDIEGDELLELLASGEPAVPCVILSGSLYEIRDIAVPANVFAKLEKGDSAGLEEALQSWSAPVNPA